MTEWVPLAEEGEIPEGERAIVEVGGTSIGVFNVDGRYYAISNYCAHEGGPVCRGDPEGAIAAEFVGSGERISERITDRLSIACPWHGWEYDLETGEHLGDSSISIPTFDVEIRDGHVCVKP